MHDLFWGDGQPISPFEVKVISVFISRLLNSISKILVFWAGYILCIIAIIASIIPCMDYGDYLNETYNIPNYGFYKYNLIGFDSNKLNTLEDNIGKDISDATVIPTLSFEVNESGLTGNSILSTLSDKRFKELETTLSDDPVPNNLYMTLYQGSIPDQNGQVLSFFDPYFTWGYEDNGPNRSIAVLPNIGECTITGIVDLQNDRQFVYPTELFGGFISLNSDFSVASTDQVVTLYVFFDKTLSGNEEMKLKQTVSKYAEVINASYSKNVLDSNPISSSIAHVKMLTAVTVILLSLCGISSLSNIIIGNMPFMNILNRLGMSKGSRFCFIFSLINICLILGTLISAIVLVIVPKVRFLSFIDCKSPSVIFVVLISEYLIHLLSGIIIYIIKERKGIRA